MIKRLVVYGLLAICATWVFTTKTSLQDKLRTQREEIEIVVVQPQTRLTDGQVTRPYGRYQTEYEKMLYPTVRITTPSGTGSGVVISVERRANSVERIVPPAAG